MKIAIGLPTPEIAGYPDFCFNNFPQIIAHAKSKGYELYINSDSNVRTDRNRNNMLVDFLEEKVDYILWIDVDMIYPVDIVQTLVEAKKDIIGCVYHKRSKPYDPVVYVASNTPGKYKSIDVSTLPNKPVEVDGIGYGGMMVARHVYESMGQEKWTHYGKNFHVPINVGDQSSHDLVFCEEAKKAGFSIWVHGGVRAGHLGISMITTDDWLRERNILKEVKNPKIAVLMPSIDKKKAIKTMNQLESTAGIDAEYFILMDDERNGFVQKIGESIHDLPHDYFVYCAEDSFGGHDWLKIAVESIGDAGLFAFNDGKWHGKLASFGMMKRDFAHSYWNEWYHSHYIDTEITLIAMRDNNLAYNPEAVLMEIDYAKHAVNQDDKKLFNQRKRELFKDRPDLEEMYG